MRRLRSVVDPSTAGPGRALLAVAVALGVWLAPASARGLVPSRTAPAISESFTTRGARAGELATTGRWSEPFDIGIVGIHAALLRDGRVLLFSRPQRAPGSAARLWDPRTGRLESASLRVRRDIFCGGHSFLPDGDVFVTGGTVYGSAGEDGVRHTFLFDPGAERWTRGPQMARARWYPTNVTLPSGRVLVFSGQRDIDSRIRAVERYDPQTGRLVVLKRNAWRRMDLYPRMHLLPSGEIFWSGQVRRTRMFDPVAEDWSFVDRMNFGSRYTGASVLLPSLDRVMALGGTHGKVGTDTVEVIDLSDPEPRWRYVQPMRNGRKHPNAVLLPDGTVLVVGGGRRGYYEEPVKVPELYRPRIDAWEEMAPQTAPRMYHSVALLLPDGRVLSAGQDQGRFSTTAEIFSPPYLFRGPRPRISTAPNRIVYGRSFAVGTDGTEVISQVVLMRPGSVTHSVDFEQRHVGLEFTEGPDGVRAVAPPTRATAPPGWYMLFLINGAGVPSVARWVHLGTAGAA